MPWGRLDDSLYDHPKLDMLGPSRLPCVGLNTLAISWSNHFLTDGFIPAERVRRLGGTIALADKLVTAGLWEEAGDDYRIHDFADFNDSAADVKERRAHMRELAKRGGKASGEARRNRDAQPGEQAGRSDSRLNSVPLPSVSRPNTPPPPTSGGRRNDGTAPRQRGENPRLTGDSPRQNGTSPRQERDERKRGPVRIGALLTEALRNGNEA